MKISRFALVILGLIMFLPSLAYSGSLNAPAAPTDTASSMFTLEGIYNLIGSGTTPATRTTFAEPTAAPGPTGHTLTELKTLIDSRAHATCDGTLSGTRWCDNGDGTVTDLTTGLIWLQNANCFATETWNNANIMSGTLFDDPPNNNCGLMDGSTAERDWRLPTKKELEQLTTGTEPILFGTTVFTGVQNNWYWSSTTDVNGTTFAWIVSLDGGIVDNSDKAISHFVWPVRGGQ